MKPNPRHSKCGRNSNVSDISFNAWVLPSGTHHAGVLVFDFAAPVPDLLQEHVHRREDVERLESRHHHRLSVHLGHEPVGRRPTTVDTWPGPRNPDSRRSGDSRMALIGGTIVTWLQKMLKLRTPAARARTSVTAVDGAVVSKPTAKKTTCRSGLSIATLSASSGE